MAEEIKIYRMQSDADIEVFKRLLIEHIDWSWDQLKVHYGVDIQVQVAMDVRSFVETRMPGVTKLMAPDGYLFLCSVDGRPAGMAGMSELAPGICEIKRMYVRPEYRGKGIGRTLFQKLDEIAKEKHYRLMRLDTGKFMRSAHKLYRANGFKEIPPYEGVGSMPEIRDYMIYFEREMPGV